MGGGPAAPRGMRRAVVMAALPGALALAVLALPSGCLAFIGGIYTGALVLTPLRLFNWALWVWLVEMTAFLYLFLHPEHPWHSIPGLILLLWSAVVLLWVGGTVVMRTVLGEPVAMVIALALAVVQIGAVHPLAMWLQDLCEIGIHCCGCG